MSIWKSDEALPGAALWEAALAGEPKPEAPLAARPVRIRTIVRRVPADQSVTAVPSVTVAEAAERYGISIQTFYRWLQAGCPHRKYGPRSYRIDFAEVDDWLKTGRAKQIADYVRSRAEKGRK